jgi:type II secretory pathway component PulJ
MEAMVALVMSALITAGVALAFRVSFDAGDRIRERSDAHAEARGALEDLTHDLSAAFLSSVNTEQTYFIAQQPEAVAPGQPFLRFSTLSHRRTPHGDAVDMEPRSDAVVVEYALESPPGLPAAGEAPRLLVRRERWLTETGEGERDLICERVAGLHLGFLDDQDPRDEWRAEPAKNPKLTLKEGEEPEESSGERKLPKGVEIVLLLSPPGGSGPDQPPRAYKTIAALGADSLPPFEPEITPPPAPQGGDNGSGGQPGGGNPGGGQPGGGNPGGGQPGGGRGGNGRIPRGAGR